MSTIWSQHTPSPLVWSPDAGQYDEMLASITGEEYTPDMGYYKINNNLYLICGYYLEMPTWYLYPVFAPEEVLSDADLITYGIHFHRGVYLKAFWADEAHSSYKVATEQNTVFQTWSALNVPNSIYTLPEIDPSNILTGVNYHYPQTLSSYTIVGIQLLDPPTGPAVTQTFPILGYHIENGRSFPVFQAGDIPTQATVRYKYWHDFYTAPGGSSSYARAYVATLVGPNNNFKLSTVSINRL